MILLLSGRKMGVSLIRLFWREGAVQVVSCRHGYIVLWY